jgi:hypothetical protein
VRVRIVIHGGKGYERKREMIMMDEGRGKTNE